MCVLLYAVAFNGAFFLRFTSSPLRASICCHANVFYSVHISCAGSLLLVVGQPFVLRFLLLHKRCRLYVSCLSVALALSSLLQDYEQYLR